MSWIITAIIIIYLVIGGVAFSLTRFMDGYNPNKWIPTFILTVFLWPIILLIWGIAALFDCTK